MLSLSKVARRFRKRRDSYNSMRHLSRSLWSGSTMNAWAVRGFFRLAVKWVRWRRSVRGRNMKALRLSWASSGALIATFWPVGLLDSQSEIAMTSDRTSRYQIFTLHISPLGAPVQVTTGTEGSQLSTEPEWSPCWLWAIAPQPNLSYQQNHCAVENQYPGKSDNHQADLNRYERRPRNVKT